MRSVRFSWLVAALVWLALSAGPVRGQTESWESLMSAGLAAYQQGDYAAAEDHWTAALKIAEGFGAGDPRVATSLNNLGALYQDQGRYAEAEPLHQRSLAIWEKVLGAEHPQVATTLNHLALLNQAQGSYAEAEPLYRRSLAILEKALGPEQPDVAASLNNLALLYHDQGRYGEAEPLYQRSLAIREKVLGPEHLDVATSLNNLAALYDAQGRYAEAEPLFQRSLAMWEKAFGPEHPNVATRASTTWQRSTMPRDATARPSLSTSVHWRSGRKWWGPSTRTWPRASTT